MNPGISLDQGRSTPTLVVPRPGDRRAAAGHLHVRRRRTPGRRRSTGRVPRLRPGAGPGLGRRPALPPPGDVRRRRRERPTTCSTRARRGTFTCARVCRSPLPTVNTATIVGQPSDADGAPAAGHPPTVQDDASAFVDVVRPGIDVVKTALVPVVARPAARPDRRSGRPPPTPPTTSTSVDQHGHRAARPQPGPAVHGRHVRAARVRRGRRRRRSARRRRDVGLHVLDGARPGAGTTSAGPGLESGLVTNTVDGHRRAVARRDAPPRSAGDAPRTPPGARHRARPRAHQVGVRRRRAPGDDVTYTFVVDQHRRRRPRPWSARADDKCPPLTFVGRRRQRQRPPRRRQLRRRRDVGPTRAPAPWPCRPTAELTRRQRRRRWSGSIRSATSTSTPPSAEVRVFDPAIHVDQDRQRRARPRRHDGDLRLRRDQHRHQPDRRRRRARQRRSGRRLRSAPSPTCAPPTFVGGDTDGDGPLHREPAETWTLRVHGHDHRADDRTSPSSPAPGAHCSSRRCP